MDVDEPRGILGFWVGTLGRYTCPSRVLTSGRPAHLYSVHAEAPRACGAGMVWWLFVRATRRLREPPAACSYERARASVCGRRVHSAVIGRVIRSQPVRSIADPRSHERRRVPKPTKAKRSLAVMVDWMANIVPRALARGRALAFLRGRADYTPTLYLAPLPATGRGVCVRRNLRHVERVPRGRAVVTAPPRTFARRRGGAALAGPAGRVALGPKRGVRAV